jgi:hypothetical protein
MDSQPTLAGSRLLGSLCRISGSSRMIDVIASSESRAMPRARKAFQFSKLFGYNGLADRAVISLL